MHDPLPLPKVQGRVLRQEVCDELRQAILAGDFAPGTRVLEVQVANSMGVSRAPVREALRQLEQEGLIEFYPHRGAVVVGLPEDEIDVIYQLRATIEGEAITRVAANATPEDIERLEESLAQIRSVRKERDTAKIAEADLHFHRTMVELSGFKLLLRVWSSLDGLVRARTYLAMADRAPGRDFLVESGVVSHAALVEAIKNGSQKQAAKAAREHVMEAADRLKGQQAGRAAGRPKARRAASPADPGMAKTPNRRPASRT
ncbi:MAG TPA: GntR family transcriptional regulator [Streptosporangiaceae bacterium]